jgi:hypothetical protein
MFVHYAKHHAEYECRGWVGCFSVPKGAKRRMTWLDREARVTIKTLVSRGMTDTAVACLMGVTGGRSLPRRGW